MFGLKINTRFDRNIVNYKAKRLTEATNNATYNTAIEIGETIQENWSAVSPSNPGEPPSVVTAKLSDSMTIIDESVGMKSIYVIRFNSGYERALEYGTPNMAARPFIAPAILRGRGIYSKNMKLELQK